MNRNESIKGGNNISGFKSLPPGRLENYSNGVGVVNVSNSDKNYAMSIVNKINTPRYQKDTFYDPAHPSHLFSKEFTDGSRVVFYDQSAKYSEISALVIAHGPNTFKNEDHKIAPLEFVEDYPKEVQQTYWRFLMGGLRSFQKSTQHIEDMRIFIGENNIASLSTDNNRTSRSIGNPHAHIVCFTESHIKPHDKTIPEPVQFLSEEQQFTQRLASHIARRIETRLPEELRGQIMITPQEQPPFGYSFIIPYTVDDIILNPAEFTELMEKHHRAYTAVSQQMEKVYREKALAAGFKQFIPQPSYRLYLEEVDNQLIAAVSPEYLSHAGVLEGASPSDNPLILYRDPSYPQRFSNEEVRNIQQDAALLIQSTLESYDPKSF